MKIMSEKTGKEYASVEECLAAEKAYDEAALKKKEDEERTKIEQLKAAAEERAKVEKLNAERKTRATEVENAYKEVIEADKRYKDLLNAFCKDYGAFHMTVHTGDLNPFNAFNHLFNFWFD